jgi:osmotically inducible protein OsmC
MLQVIEPRIVRRLMEFRREATVDWSGSIMEGTGTAKAGTGAFTLPVSFPRRIGDPEGSTSPEELIAAAHATCYAMVIAATMGRKGVSAARHSVTCTVIADKGDAGIQIQTSKLDLVAEGVSGIDAAGFEAMAREAEGKCPVSNALRGSLKIEVTVRVQ